MRKSRSISPTPTGSPPGLRGIVRGRFLKDVFQASAEKCPGWKVLIVDSHAMRVISSAIGMYDIMERKVTLVESLEKKRAPFPNMDAIYVIEPSELSITLLLDDFSKGKALYGKNVFLYFLGRLSDASLDKIKACRDLLKRLKCLTEINIDFLTKEERAFTFDMRDQFANFYLRRSNTPSELVIAEKLVTVCGTLNEYPHIRFRESSALASSLANVFHLKMGEFISQNASWWYHGGPSNNGQQVSQRERSTLIILDRSDDCLSPLMHEYSYECLVHDLLKIDGDKITYEESTTDGGVTKKQPKDVLLDEKDTIWTELRGKHVAEVSQVLSARIREIMNSSTGNALISKNNGGNLSMSEMANALKSLPEYQEVLSKLGQHLNLSLECLDTFTKRQLKDLAELEQTMATGLNDDLKQPKLADIIDSIETYLMNLESPKDRIRLLLAATIALQGLRQQDRRRLLYCAELGDGGLKTIDALTTLGVSTQNGDDKNRLLSPFHPKAIAEDDPDSDFQGSRYVPILKSILEEAYNRSLSFHDYPSVLPMPDEAMPSKGGKKKSGGVASSARKSGATSRWSTSGGPSKKTSGPSHLSGPRIIVFVIGGACYSELRVCREVMEREGREVILGSTAFISANEFIEDLSKLNET